MKQIQGDHLSLLAERVRPYLLGALANEDVMRGLTPEERSRVEEAAGHISAWDLRCETGLPDPFSGEPPSPEDVESSTAASIFFVCLNRLTQAVFDDEMSRAGRGLGTDDRAKALLHILEHTGEAADSPFYVHTLGPGAESRLWDNLDTPDKEETRNEIIVQATVRALNDLASLMGTSSMNSWRWGEIHRLTYRLEGLGSAVLAYNLPGYSIWDQVLGSDAKGYPRSGGLWTVDPANYSLSGLDFRPGSGPAMRMVVELEEGVMRASNVIPGGANDLQPGADISNPVRVRPDIHYGDQIPLWLANQYRPQLIFWEDVTDVAESRIRFQPE
jgi:acyl-homoserine lactone acylase PvdQ